jgi:hypothetical protein
MGGPKILMGISISEAGRAGKESRSRDGAVDTSFFDEVQEARKSTDSKRTAILPLMLALLMFITI